MRKTFPSYRAQADNPWLELRENRSPEDGVNGYVFSHEKRCGGQIVAVLPFRFTPAGTREWLVRLEVTPCWSAEQEESAITGGCEKFSEVSIAAQAASEVREEAGYEVPPERFNYLGTCHGTKSSDTVYHLYNVDVSSYEQGEALGDGSVLESTGGTRWRGDPTSNTEDPLLYVLFCRSIR